VATLRDATQSFLESLELAGKSPLTLDSYGRHLTEFEDWLDKPLAIDEIESSQVKGFLLHLKRRPKRPGYQHRTEPEGGLAPETMRHYFWTLRSFFGWSEHEGLLNGYRPMENVPKPASNRPEVRTLSKAEVGRLLDLLDKPEVKKRTLLVAFSLMAGLGLRISEVCNLRLADVNLETGWLFVQGKGKKERRLPIRNGLADLLQTYVSELRPKYANGSDTLLVSYTGSPLLPSSLRHSFATQFIRDGGSVYTLKRILGHSDIKTTERYVHAASVDDIAAALDKMDWV